VTKLQQVLFAVETPYYGHPYFVTGNALYHAIARRADDQTRQHLHVSHGQFVPGEYASFPDAHSNPGSAGKQGGSLPPVEQYADLFVFRDAAQRWLLDSRPRDAHNAVPLQTYGDRVVMAPTTTFGRPDGQRHRRRTVDWYVQCYLHVPEGTRDEVLPVNDVVLDGLRLGGARNYGFGLFDLVDTQLVELDDLNYTRLREAASDAAPCRIELVTPYVAQSDYPDADSQPVPWWWDPSEQSGPGNYSQATGMRRRAARLVADDTTYDLDVLDHGQRVGFAGDPDRIVETAKNGVRRIGTHSRFGFGEVRVRPPETDRVPARDGVSESNASGGGSE
jgi:hypothetical protein